MNYFLKLFKTGAVRKTPEKVISRIVGEIENRSGETRIIELGAGRGEITTQVMNKLEGRGKADYHAFEIDEKAFAFLKQTLPNVIIHNKDAFDFNSEVPGLFYADYIISSIPLSFYKKDKIEALLSTMKNQLKEDGKIIILFSAVWLIPFFKKLLINGRLISFFTFPPYFIFSYSKSNT